MKVLLQDWAGVAIGVLSMVGVLLGKFSLATGTYLMLVSCFVLLLGIRRAQ